MKNDGMQEIITYIGDIFSNLEEIFSPDMTFKDIIDKYSPIVDDVIRKLESASLKFVGGDFKITALDGNNFVCSYELYFNDKKNKWQKSASTSEPMDMNYWLSKETRSELKQIKEKLFKVIAPD